MTKAPDTRVETRQRKLQANSEAIQRWHRKLFRAATELKKLTEQRKRLLKTPKSIVETYKTDDDKQIDLESYLNNDLTNI